VSLSIFDVFVICHKHGQRILTVKGEVKNGFTR
jgi:hypothetical protein